MLNLNAPQNIFINGLNTKYRAFIGGFGSSKTFCGCLDLLIFASQHPKTVQGYFAPTYPDIRDIFYPSITEAAELMGYRVVINTTNKEVQLYRGRVYYGMIICRSMERPDSIVGFKIARALVDEIDILPKDKANKAWNKIIARLRLVIDGVINSVGVTTTPEGFRFVYSKFSENPTESYSMVQASTYENEQYLPDDYIKTLEETYPSELVKAYIYGEFVNLTSGTVYNAYKREKNRSSETIQDKEPLFIGMDFNVANMSAIVYVKRDGNYHAANELMGIYDTPSIIDTIDEKWPEHNITIYPDATGKSRKSVDASKSDISLLKSAGYKIKAKAKNPFVRDRILASNKAFTNGALMVNDKMCPEYARCLEQLAYDKNGEPDKKSGLDHAADAGTYLPAYELPIKKPVSRARGYV